jgi:TonB-linked SusC/RagA family outer membrane protein
MGSTLNSKELTNAIVSINVKNKPLKDVLNELLAPFPLSFRVIDDKIVISHDGSKNKSLPAENKSLLVIPIKGKVTDEQGQPLPGATVKLKQSNNGVITDKDGNFAITNIPITGVLIISYVGYQTVEISYDSKQNEPLIIQLKADANSLNAVQVIGYGTTTKRLNTGSVSTISAKEIEQQPVTNVLSALSGRMPGVFVQTTNGLPGGNINIQIRGTGSITAGNNPLYVIDGVPFNSIVGLLNAQSILSTGAISGVISPFNSLNPDDIESISILKDADATSIYGSRGSNGVVLITTKKGKSGKTKVNISVNEGYTQATNIPKVLNLSQYLQIRHEAFVNDGITPSSDPNSYPNYAPDLTIWSQKQSTNWPKYFLGGTGQVNNEQATISGGNDATNFTVGSNFHSEKTYLPGNNLYDRGGIYANLQHTSENKKFYFQFSNSLTIDNNNLVDPAANIYQDILLPPNYPIYDQYGNYNWEAGGNPAAEITSISKTSTNNVISNILLRYTIIKDLAIKISAGYNEISVNQTQIHPSSSLYPGSTNYTDFGKNSNQSYIIEPQLTYDYRFKSSTLNLLAGGTYQNSNSLGQVIRANNYSSTALMGDLGSASYYYPSNNYTQYKYASVFGRVTYNLDDKYILNATVRRDGSSRFGPNEQFGNFGSIGAAWLWADENFIKSNMAFISFGKLRASYGVTGNDQIADYQYLSSYSSAYTIYQGIAALKPSRIANPDFHWETTKKLDVGLELGFLKNRILLNIDRYQNLSDDQLVSYAIPSITGFTSYEANLPAVVENSGWEFDLNTKNVQKDKFSWTTSFNFTVPKNKLKNFPGLSTSSYANTLAVGEDITRVYGYQFEGLDNNGNALYATRNGTPSNSPNSATDSYYTIGKKTPDFYGGIGNTLTYQNWSLEIFGQFVKQMAFGNLIYTPGAYGFNDYIIGLNRWTSTNSHTTIPKASNNGDFNYPQSSANYFNTSYFRVKNVAIFYSLPKNWLQKVKMDQARLFLQAQNILTFWNRNIPLLDPESGPTTGGLSNNLPPVKSFVLGIQTTF